MKLSDRIKLWRKMGQTTTTSPPPAGDAPTTADTPSATAGTATPVQLTGIPGYRAVLFSVKPEFANDLVAIINIVNKYLYMLSKGQAQFSDTWLKVSASPDQYFGGVKNLYTMAKYLYGCLTAEGTGYSITALRQIGQNLTTMVNSMTFSEPQGGQIKSEITSAVQVLLNKTGT